jgi:23S rRNA (cytosine1962-C5)-methyltransferase
MSKYRLLDCGNQKKLEILGNFKVVRPCPQAVWDITKPELWEGISCEFFNQAGEKGIWQNLDPKAKYIVTSNKEEESKLIQSSKTNSKISSKPSLPKDWTMESDNGTIWKIEPNEYGNIGVFTEHWLYGPDLNKVLKPKSKILNLFTYSGSNCVSLAKDGYQITAVDSSKAAMDRYVENLTLNNVDRDGQRLILEDAYKFVAREHRRNVLYDCVMIDAPSYGRGTKGEVFKIEESLVKLVKTCKAVLDPKGYMLVTLHSPRFTCAILDILMTQLMPDYSVKTTEILQQCESGVPLPSGFLVMVSPK